MGGGHPTSNWTQRIPLDWGWGGGEVGGQVCLTATRQRRRGEIAFVGKHKSCQHERLMTQDMKKSSNSRTHTHTHTQGCVSSSQHAAYEDKSRPNWDYLDGITSAQQEESSLLAGEQQVRDLQREQRSSSEVWESKTRLLKALGSSGTPGFIDLHRV